MNGPLLELEQRVLDASTSIERWFRLRWQAHELPFYCSVDLRNSGFKLAPVDTNLYPGGFNNLIGSLCTIGILDKPAPGAVAVSAWAREVLS